MNRIGMRRSGEVRDVLVGIVAFVAIILVVRGCVGCGREVKQSTKPAPSQIRATPVEPDFSDLQGVMAGGWKKETTGDGYSYILLCTDQTLTWKFEEVREGMKSRLDPLIHGSIVCSYKMDGKHIQVTDTKGESQSFVVEFISGREAIFAPVHDEKKQSGTFIPENAKNMARSISGRWVRTSRPSNSTDPIAQAKQQVQRIGQKQKKVESLRDDAAKESDEIVSKLRELGVESSADLKRNPRTVRMAENLAKLAAEIEAMDSQLAMIDTELVKARSIVRRMEREQAGISDEEMRSLAEQLRDAEARTDAAPKPITPLDVDAAFEAALKSRKTPVREKK
ncbi:hypothetical protein BH11PLA2_BH11PLA2_16320 [soil metagenome]